MNGVKLKVLVGLKIITILIAFTLAQFFSNYTPIVYILMTLLIFTIIALIFDRFLWRLPILYSIGWVDIPYLGGEWEGKLTTSFDEQSRITDVRIFITQTWTSLKVNFYATKAMSTSLNASIFLDDSGDYVLTYSYHAMPREHGDMTDPPHIGLAVLRLTERNRLSGYYHYFYQDTVVEALIQGQLVFERRLNTILPETTL